MRCIVDPASFCGFALAEWQIYVEMRVGLAQEEAGSTWLFVVLGVGSRPAVGRLLSGVTRGLDFVLWVEWIVFVRLESFDGEVGPSWWE